MYKRQTPLRYPGGKSRAAERLLKLAPQCKEFREPFLGGGSVALRFTQDNPTADVWVNDLYGHLYNFWKVLQSDYKNLSDSLIEYKNSHNDEVLAKELFNTAKESIADAESFEAACYFWILNKCSYSGLTENSSFSKTASKQNFTVSGAQNLKSVGALIGHWNITNYDYSEVMNDDHDHRGDVFVFLDPPYKIKSYLYGTNAELHKDFDHKIFYDNCQVCPHKWMITYNIDDEIEEWYDNYKQEYFQLTYGMKHRGSKNRNQQELLIKNYEAKVANPLEVMYAG